MGAIVVLARRATRVPGRAGGTVPAGSQIVLIRIVEPDAYFGGGRSAVSLPVAARLLPGGGIWNSTGPAEATHQAGDLRFRWGGGEGI